MGFLVTLLVTTIATLYSITSSHILSACIRYLNILLHGPRETVWIIHGNSKDIIVYCPNYKDIELLMTTIRILSKEVAATI